MTIPKVKEANLRELATRMRPDIKNGPACLEAVAFTMLNHDPGFLNIFRGVYRNITPAAFMTYHLLYSAAGGKLPVLNSVIQESVKDDFWNLGLTNDTIFRASILGEITRIRQEDPLYIQFIGHLALQNDNEKERDQIYEEGIMVYNAIERAMWSKAPSKRRTIKSPAL